MNTQAHTVIILTIMLSTKGKHCNVSSFSILTPQRRSKTVWLEIIPLQYANHIHINIIQRVGFFLRLKVKSTYHKFTVSNVCVYIYIYIYQWPPNLTLQEHITHIPCGTSWMLKCKTILQQYLINVVNKISKSRQDLEFVCVKNHSAGSCHCKSAHQSCQYITS